MSIRFWENPEFVRHVRAELRITRALTILVVVVVICILVWLACWGAQQSQMDAYRRGNHDFGNPSSGALAELEQRSTIEVWLNFLRCLVYAQLAVLTFWSLLRCAQSVAGEREYKTWDFQRATRLTPGEFLVGKLLGEPIVAYFIVLCCIPITFLAGWRGHIPIGNILSAYMLIVSAALFIGLAGLWLSTLFETRSRGIGLIGTFGFYLFFGLTFYWVNSSFPGLAAFNPLSGLLPLLGEEHLNRLATIFGSRLPWPAVGLILYVTFGGWFVLMILRGLKKDFDQIKPLSRWQAVACAAFLNFTAYAFYQPIFQDRLRGRVRMLYAENFASFMVAVSGFILFAMGLAMITPFDHLKIWWRSRIGLKSLLAEDGLPWPWLVVSAAVGYALFVWGMFVWKNEVGFDRNLLLSGLLQSIAALVFVTRDILFLQWCRLTRMRAPILKGFLYLALYYIAAIVLSTVVEFSSYSRAQTIQAILTPIGAFGTTPSNVAYLPEVIAGLVVQLTLIFLLLRAINSRLGHAAPINRLA